MSFCGNIMIQSLGKTFHTAMESKICILFVCRKSQKRELKKCGFLRFLYLEDLFYKRAPIVFLTFLFKDFSNWQIWAKNLIN